MTGQAVPARPRLGAGPCATQSTPASPRTSPDHPVCALLRAGSVDRTRRCGYFWYNRGRFGIRSTEPGRNVPVRLSLFELLFQPLEGYSPPRPPSSSFLRYPVGRGKCPKTRRKCMIQCDVRADPLLYDHGTTCCRSRGIGARI